MKNFDGLINRPDRAEKRISEFENRSVEIIQTKTQKEKKSDVRSKRNEINMAQIFHVSTFIFVFLKASLF